MGIKGILPADFVTRQMPRRLALKSMAIGLSALATSPIYSEETSSDKQYLDKLDLSFEDLLRAPPHQAYNHSPGLEPYPKFCDQIQENYNLFSTWYKTQVNNIISEKNKTEKLQKKEFALVEIGK